MRLFKYQSFIATQVDSPHWSVQFGQKVCMPLIIDHFVMLAHTLTEVDTPLWSFSDIIMLIETAYYNSANYTHCYFQ